jgi:hypothetical protein
MSGDSSWQEGVDRDVVFLVMGGDVNDRDRIRGFISEKFGFGGDLWP